MLIFDSNDDVLILDNIYTPTSADYFWVLDLNMLDFTLAPLLVLEETVCPTIEVQVLGFRFNLPATWNVLVTDPETMQLDVVEVSEIAGKQFHVFIHGPRKPRMETGTITVTDFFLTRKNVGPSINKHQMLCHPVSPDSWINVAPSDTYNKYLKDRVAGDLV